MNGTFKIGAGALDAHGAPMYLTAERLGGTCSSGGSRGMTVFPRRPAGMTMPGSVCGCCPMRVGETVRTGETRDAAGAAEATTPNPRPSLPVTGGDVSLASVLAVSALAIGAILSIVVRWRRRYDRFNTGRCAGRYVDPLRHDADDVAGW